MILLSIGMLRGRAALAVRQARTDTESRPSRLILACLTAHGRGRTLRSVAAGFEMLHELDPHAARAVEEDDPMRQLVGFRAVEPANLAGRRPRRRPATCTRGSLSGSGWT